jgi:predicted nucleotidyltransferase
MNAAGFEILKLLMRYDSLSPKDICGLTGASRAYIHSVLKSLNETGLITYDRFSPTHRIINNENPVILKLREFFTIEGDNEKRLEILSAKYPRKIIQCFATNKILTKKQLEELTGFSRATVEKILSDLIHERIIQYVKGHPCKYYLDKSPRNRLLCDLSLMLENGHKNNEKLIGYNELVKLLIKNKRVHALIPYGSSSFGMHDEKSDIDLFVVVSDREALGEIKSIRRDPNIELNLMLVKDLPGFVRKEPQFAGQLLSAPILKGRKLMESICGK